jgi:hypothetical protein
MKEWTTFTTPQNKIITLPPRRYIVIGSVPKVPTNDQLEDVKLMLDMYHNPAAAPEPMIQLQSHFQILQHVLNKNLQ